MMMMATMMMKAGRGDLGGRLGDRGDRGCSVAVWFKGRSGTGLLVTRKSRTPPHPCSSRCPQFPHRTRQLTWAHAVAVEREKAAINRLCPSWSSMRKGVSWGQGEGLSREQYSRWGRQQAMGRTKLPSPKSSR